MTKQPLATFLRIASALYGLAIAYALRPHFAAESAPPGQAVGYATAHGLDAFAPVRFYLACVALTVLMPLLLRPLFARLRGSIAIAVWGGALWFATIETDPIWVIGIGVAGIAAALVPYDARARFRRADAILIPTFATVYLALIDLTPSLSLPKHVVIAAGIVLTVRLVVGSADCFALAPLGLVLQAHFNALHLRHLGWPSLLIAVGTPLVWKAVVGRRRTPRLVAFVIYPIVALAYASASSKLGAEGKPHGDLFEDAHHFVMASEMLRGEKPYIDIVPGHGLIDDGLLDYVIARTGPVTEGRLAKTHGVMSALNAVGYYAVAAAATGSPDVGLLTYFLAVTLGLGGGMLRLFPALAALAFMVAAVRTDRPRLLAPAGALVVLAILTSLDFGAYSLITLIATVAIMRGTWRRAAIAAATGVGVAGLITMIAMASAGIFTAFLRTTLFEIAPASKIFDLGLPPPITIAFPAILLEIFNPRGFALLGLAMAVVILATVRKRPIVVMAVLTVAAAMYYAERHQFYFAHFLPPLIAASIFYLFRYSRAAAIAALTVLLLAANLTASLTTLTMMWTTRGPLDDQSIEIAGIPRAQGAFFSPVEAEMIAGVDRYARERLGYDDTFYDFADAPNLFFLLNRDCPIRQIEAPFDQPEALQRDVIARLERNKHVRAALVQTYPGVGIDGVPNSVRVPLVWRYLQANFEPDVVVGNITIWRRVRF